MVKTTGVTPGSNHIGLRFVAGHLRRFRPQITGLFGAARQSQRIAARDFTEATTERTVEDGTLFAVGRVRGYSADTALIHGKGAWARKVGCANP
jgi:hypothetical protein